MSAPPRPRRRSPLLVPVGLLLAAVVVGFLLTFALRVAYANEALPGTRVAGVSLGGAKASEVRKRLTPVVGADVPVVLRAAGQTFRVLPAQAGYEVDLDATVHNAINAGRGGLLSGAVSTVKGVVDPRDVALVVQVDQSRLDATVASIAGKVDRAPFPGELRITGPADVDVVDPREGRKVDRAALRRLLERAIRRRAGAAAVAVPVALTPVASEQEVQGVASEAVDYLSAPLKLTGAGKALKVSDDQLAGVLALESLDGGRRVRLGAGDQRLTALVNTIAKERERPAKNARISTSGPGATLDAKGDTSWSPKRAKVTVRDGEPGREVRRPETVAAVEAAIHAKKHTATLPVKRVEAVVSRTAAKKIDHLIGTFTTHYVPGQPRVTNIRRIARAVDGTIIAPGKQFSLNGVAGERTLAKGYVPAPFIGEGNKLEPSVGGGVSQASTTIYNAAYFAGLKIDTHTPHSVFISRYPAGRESTLNFGSIDLLWTNDTGTPIFVSAKTTADSITVSLYGDNGGRRVRAESGAREKVPGGDFKLTVTRVVRYADGHVTREPFTSTYGIEQPADE